MKAWVVWPDGEDWCEFVHADSAGKAKLSVINEYEVQPVGVVFTNYRARRCPWLDGEPRRSTKAELIEHGFTEYAEETPDVT